MHRTAAKIVKVQHMPRKQIGASGKNAKRGDVIQITTTAKSMLMLLTMVTYHLLTICICYFSISIRMFSM